jgi:hypothetical protein
VPGVPDTTRAKKDAEAILGLFEQLGLPFHEVEGPTTRVESHLGWGIDTMKWEIFIPPKRLEVASSLLETWISMKRCKLRDLASFCGFFQFIAMPFECLKPPLGHVIHLQTKYQAIAAKHGNRKGWRITDRVRAACAWLRYYIRIWDGKIAISYIGHATALPLYVDSCCHQVGLSVWGAGAFFPSTGEFFAVPWSSDVLLKSVRDKTNSMPYLEAYCMVMAVAAMSTSGLRLTIYTDCEPVVDAFKRRYSSNRPLLELIHTLDIILLQKHISLDMIPTSRERIT